MKTYAIARCLLGCTAALYAIQATAAPSPEPSAGGVSWPAAASPDPVQLRVSTPSGEVIKKTFAPGQIPSINGPLADGQYVYEFRWQASAPTASSEENVEADEVTENGRASEAQNASAPRAPESGGFRIVNGTIPEASETEAR